MAKAQDISSETRREVKLHDNPNISSNEEEGIRELPPGCLQISLQQRCNAMRMRGAGGGLGVRSGDGLEQLLWILRNSLRHSSINCRKPQPSFVTLPNNSWQLRY